MELVVDNLVSPITLSFVLGMIACWIRSDLEVPGPLYQGLSIYLLFAIGLKGGVAVSETPLAELIWPAIATAVLGIITPFSAFLILRYFGKLKLVDAAAAAAAIAPFEYVNLYFLCKIINFLKSL